MSGTNRFWEFRKLNPHNDWSRLHHCGIFFCSAYLENLQEFKTELLPNTQIMILGINSLKKFPSPFLGFFKFSQNITKNNIRGLSSINARMQTALLVIIDQRSCLCVVCFKAFRQGSLIIIWSTSKRFTSNLQRIWKSFDISINSRQIKKQIITNYNVTINSVALS